MRCEEDIDYQASVTTLSAYWDIPSSQAHYLTDVFIRVEVRDHLGGCISSIENASDFS